MITDDFDRYELMVACVTVLRAMPCEVLCDQWLLASGRAARRAFYGLLQVILVSMIVRVCVDIFFFLLLFVKKRHL
jgi:hypothetical protein